MRGLDPDRHQKTVVNFCCFQTVSLFKVYMSNNTTYFNYTTSSSAPSPIDEFTEQSPWEFTQMDTEFVSFCLLFGLALLFYLAGSPY